MNFDDNSSDKAPLKDYSNKQIVKLADAVRDEKGWNKNLSKRLNEKIVSHATYVGGAFRNFTENWNEIKDIAKEEGISIEICEAEFRYHVRGLLSKDQIYHLFHREERNAGSQARRLEQKEELEKLRIAKSKKPSEAENITPTEPVDQEPENNRIATKPNTPESEDKDKIIAGLREQLSDFRKNLEELMKGTDKLSDEEFGKAVRKWVKAVIKGLRSRHV